MLGRPFDPFDRSIDLHIGKVRRKLGDRADGDERIKTIRGVGYIYAQREAQEALVTGDAALLSSAVENVVRNAVRYTPPGSYVDISLDITPTHARIVIRDHGPGVPPDDVERIFLPFNRVGAARDRESGGTGLGLSIAARAAKVHGGSIAVANAADGGLQVTITLPPSHGSG